MENTTMDNKYKSAVIERIDTLFNRVDRFVSRVRQDDRDGPIKAIITEAYPGRKELILTSWLDMKTAVEVEHPEVMTTEPQDTGIIDVDIYHAMRDVGYTLAEACGRDVDDLSRRVTTATQELSSGQIRRAREEREAREARFREEQEQEEGETVRLYGTIFTTEE